MTHDLKTLPQYFDAVASGEKRFEVRKDDRCFQKGDTLRLLRMDRKYFDDVYEVEEPQRVLEVRVTFILPGGQFGIQPGYVVMGVEKVECDSRRCLVCGANNVPLGVRYYCHDHYREVESTARLKETADKMVQQQIQEINRLGRQLSGMRWPNQIEPSDPDGGAA